MHSKFPDGLNSLSCFPRWLLYNTGGGTQTRQLITCPRVPFSSSELFSGLIRFLFFLSGFSPAGREVVFFFFFFFFSDGRAHTIMVEKTNEGLVLSPGSLPAAFFLLVFLLLPPLLLFLLPFLQQCVGRRSAHSRERGEQKKREREKKLLCIYITSRFRRGGGGEGGRRRRRRAARAPSAWHLRTLGKPAAEPYEGNYRGNTFSQRIHLFHSHTNTFVLLFTSTANTTLLYHTNSTQIHSPTIKSLNISWSRLKYPAEKLKDYFTQKMKTQSLTTEHHADGELLSLQNTPRASQQNTIAALCETSEAYRDLF